MALAGSARTCSDLFDLATGDPWSTDPYVVLDVTKKSTSVELKARRTAMLKKFFSHDARDARLIRAQQRINDAFRAVTSDKGMRDWNKSNGPGTQPPKENRQPGPGEVDETPWSPTPAQRLKANQEYAEYYRAQALTTEKFTRAAGSNAAEARYAKSDAIIHTILNFKNEVAPAEVKKFAGYVVLSIVELRTLPIRTKAAQIAGREYVRWFYQSEWRQELIDVEYELCDLQGALGHSYPRTTEGTADALYVLFDLYEGRHGAFTNAKLIELLLRDDLSEKNPKLDRVAVVFEALASTGGTSREPLSRSDREEYEPRHQEFVDALLELIAQQPTEIQVRKLNELMNRRTLDRVTLGKVKAQRDKLRREMSTWFR